MALFTVIQEVQYDIDADTVEEARDKWLKNEWDWESKTEPEVCPIYDEFAKLVYEP